MWTVLLASAVWAQEAPETTPQFDAQLFRHSVDATHTLWTDDSGTAPSGYFSGKVGVNYFTNPVVYYPLEGGQVGALNDALGMNVIASMNVSRFRIGLDLPFYVSANSDITGPSNGLGDVALDVKGTLLDPKEAPLGLAIAARVGLPSSSVDAPLGSGGVTYEISGIADLRVGNALIAGNLGHRGVPGVNLHRDADEEELRWDDMLVWRLGAGYGFNEALVAGISADLSSSFVYPLPTLPEQAPLEGILGAWVKPTDSLVLRAGAGTGISPGIGAPDLRAIFAIAYVPPHVRDEDADGIADKFDDCPQDPEDKDGYQDKDGCPDPTTRVRVLFVDEAGNEVPGVVSSVKGEEVDLAGTSQLDFETHPNTVMITATADGFAAVEQELAVPDRARFKTTIEMALKKGKLVIRVQDPDGNPIDARVKVGEAEPFVTKDGKRAIAAKPGTYPLMVVAEEFRVSESEVKVVADEISDITITLEYAKAKVTKEKIEILEKVFFDTDEATIKAESYPILEEVASVLRAYPDILRVDVEGHTDSRGDADHNRDLSQRRAASVRQFLINKGIDGSRLEPRGYGEDRPLKKGNSTAAYDMNRRVEFVIVEREGFDSEGNPVP